MTHRLLRLFFPLAVVVCLAAPADAQLRGIIDVHAHSDPDNQPRRLDALDLAKQAQAEGMRAVVLKNHQMPTTQLAYMVNKLVPGFQAFGSIVLNRAVGGMNPQAVEQQATVIGKSFKVVFMPSVDAESAAARNANPPRPYVPVAKNGALLPETIEVLKVMAKYDLVLATGHSQPADSLLLISEGKKLGVTRFVVTHAINQGMTIPQMQEAARNGAYLEFTGNPILPAGQNGSLTIIPNAPNRKAEEWASAMHAVGADHVVLAGDFGGTNFPPFFEGWKMYVTALKAAGVTDAEIDAMARKNPAKLLGMSE
jgi:hypothetical protein